ncbi:thymus-specific serine protease [Lingula anatina]|uniref:Thymus-specific serine protease n=1 Tax=Lingula anatina TaxID=7574 RepID=A0A1S3KFI5_LINAN|nr:thymus-specific serine protease [Lingula anatina]|eukprot:XP_013421400.1 thymus-specific serine protease [Lingula anatina]
MYLRFILLVIFVVVVDEALSLGINHWKFREKLQEYRRQRLHLEVHRKLGGKFPDAVSDIFPAEYLTQPLDHFDSENRATYKQRYWVNSGSWMKKQDGPVFLFIGGESGLSEFDVIMGEHVQLAEKYSALIFAVEHRFYGDSLNDDGLELKNLKFLSSQQALADLASFYEHAVNKYNLTERNTWICFGGSYPGALSAWFRLKYPHIVYGAIASSAPVRAQANFEGYNDVVASSLADPVVKGSQECASAVRKAFSQVDDMLKRGQHRHLAEDFQSCGDISSHYDTVTFVSNLADHFMSVVQYNGEMPNVNISRLCQMMTGSSDPYYNLMTINKMMLNATEEKCVDNSWANYTKKLSNVTVTRGDTGMMRQWTFQTCTQFGYYQTCDEGSRCLFSHQMDFQSNLDICQSVFNIPGEEVARRVDFTNAYYGADRPKGSRIVFVNGSIDPWHALSVLRNQSSTEVAIFINGTAHCANMESAVPQDPPALTQARQKISDIIGEWLRDASGHAGKKDPNTLYFQKL